MIEFVLKSTGDRVWLNVFLIKSLRRSHDDNTSAVEMTDGEEVHVEGDITNAAKAINRAIRSLNFAPKA